MKRLGAAIVGCGGISASYVDLLTRFPRMARLVAFCDLAEERAANRQALARRKCAERAAQWREQAETASPVEAEELRAQARLAEEDARAPTETVTDFKTLVRNDDLDLVVVCTPPPHHAAPAIAALEHGKHVFCQGPMATTVRDCDRMLRAAEDGRAKLSIQNLLRFTYEAEVARRVIREGRLGRLILSSAEMLWYRGDDYYAQDAWRGTWEGEGGGAFFHHGRYVMDLYLHCVGEAVASVFAYSATLTHRIEVEDVLTASLRFGGGALGKVAATVGAVPNPAIPRDRIEVFGEEGSLSLIPAYTREGGRLTIGMRSPERQAEIEAAIADEVSRPTEEPTVLQMRRFLQCVHDDTEPPIPGESARAQVELTRAAYASAHRRQPVELPLDPEDPFY